MVIHTIRGETGVDNPFEAAGTGAAISKTGLFHSLTSTGGEGLFSTSMTAVGSNTSVNSTTEGRGQQYATGAVSGNNAGLRQTILLYRREWSNHMKIRVLPSTTSAIRAFIGWSSDTAEIAGETTLDNFSGAGVGKRAADTNWHIIKNDGDATTDFVDTGTAFAASAVTIELLLNSAGFLVTIGGTEEAIETTEIPATTTMMAFHCQIETSDGSDKNIQIFPVYARIGT